MLNKLIEVVSPAMALRRQRARVQLGLVRKFDLAGNSRRTNSLNRVNRGPNRSLEYQQSRLLASVRDLTRNNGYAASAVAKLAGHVVGRGITARPDALTNTGKANKLLNKRAQSVWASWQESVSPDGLLDWAGTQRLGFRSIVEGGEVFLKWSYGRDGRLMCQLLESEYCDEKLTRDLENGGKIVQGVEFNAAGERVAYWLFDDHPHELMQLSHTAKRVGAEFVDHVFLPLRAGQVRGIPWLTSVGLDLSDLADIDQALLMRVKMEACVGAVVHQDPLQDSKPLSDSGQTDGNGNPLESFAPGMVAHLSDGQTITALDFTPSQNVTGFVQQMLYKIGAGIGLPYHSLTGDVSKANYSSLRAALLDYWALLDQYQYHMMIPMMCRPAWRRVMRHMALSDARLNDVPAKYTPPVRPFVDPKKDVDAAVAEVRAGFASMPDKLSERGQDPDAQLEEIAGWAGKLDKLGLALETDPRIDAPTKETDIEEHTSPITANPRAA